MADWTLSSALGFRPYRCPKGTPPLRYYPESTCASTAIIRLGQVVQIDANSTGEGEKIKKADVASSNAGIPSTVVRIVGVAAEGSTGTGSSAAFASGRTKGQQIGVWLADADTEFLAYLRGTGPANSSMIGVQKLVFYDSTLQTYFVDSTNSTVALAVVVVSDIPDWAVGDTNGPVVVKFLNARCAADVR